MAKKEGPMFDNMGLPEKPEPRFRFDEGPPRKKRGARLKYAPPLRLSNALKEKVAAYAEASGTGIKYTCCHVLGVLQSPVEKVPDVGKKEWIQRSTVLMCIKCAENRRLNGFKKNLPVD